MKYHQNYAAKYKLFGKNTSEQLIIKTLSPYFILYFVTILAVRLSEEITDHCPALA
jgi:hypothetical protein